MHINFDNNRDGAVSIFQNKVTIVNSYFSGNVAHEGAAAIQANYGSKTIITDTQFCYNEVDFDYYKLKVYIISTPGGAVNRRTCEVEICRKYRYLNINLSYYGSYVLELLYRKSSLFVISI